MSTNNVIKKFGRRLNVQELLSEFFEFATSGVKSISTDHHMIHAKRGYIVWLDEASLADSASVSMTLTTPEEGYVHLKRYEGWSSSAKAKLEVFEAPEAVTGGTSKTPQNRSRVLPIRESQVTVLDAPTVTLGSAVKVDEIVFGGGGTNPQSKAGGDRSMDMELLLKPNTTYVVRVTNDSGATANVWASLFWYEEIYGE